jgi:putative acetyltransferase
MSISIERACAPTAEIRELVEELDRALATLYVAEQRHGLSLDLFFEPGIRFFIARVENAAAGCGGIALLDGYAEVKRMYTRPHLRGRGVARAVLHRLEAEARHTGMTCLRLETGAHQPEALRLHERAGFERCLPFGAYALMPRHHIELSLFYEKAV